MTSTVLSSKSSSAARVPNTSELESPMKDFMAQVIKFNQPHTSLCSQFEYLDTLNSGSDAYEEISLSQQSTPECTKKQINLNTNPELHFDDLPYSPRHKRVKSHPIDLSNLLSTLTNRPRGYLGLTDILAAINPGSNCSTIVKPIGRIDTLDWDSSTFILQQSPKLKKGIDFESVISADESSISFKDCAELPKPYTRKQSYENKEISAFSGLSEPLGSTSCTTMCYRCNQLVITSVEFYEGPVLNSLLEFIDKVIGCCSPIWLNKYKVHKCTLCRSVLS